MALPETPTCPHRLGLRVGRRGPSPSTRRAPPLTSMWPAVPSNSPSAWTSAGGSASTVTAAMSSMTWTPRAFPSRRPGQDPHPHVGDPVQGEGFEDGDVDSLRRMVREAQRHLAEVGVRPVSLDEERDRVELLLTGARRVGWGADAETPQDDVEGRSTVVEPSEMGLASRAFLGRLHDLGIQADPAEKVARPVRRRPLRSRSRWRRAAAGSALSR